METFLPHGSTLGDPSNNWVGKIASGFAGARPAQASTAGKQQIPDKKQDDGDARANGTRHGDAKGAAPGPGNGVHIENMYTDSRDNGTAVAADINRQTNAYGAGLGH